MPCASKMPSKDILILSLILLLLSSSGDRHDGAAGEAAPAKHAAAAAAAIPCGFDLAARVLWSSPVGGPGSPFVAAPLLAPLLPSSSTGAAAASSASGSFVVVSAAFHGEIGVLSASTGRPLPGSRYPIHLPAATVYASPLLHDVDADGSLDVVVATGEGLLHAFHLVDATRVVDSFAVEPLRAVDRKWLEETAAAAEEEGKRTFPHLVVRFAADAPGGGGGGEMVHEKRTTTMEPRVMASPVITDLNGDGRF